MFDATNPVSIFVPMLVVVALTFVAFVRMIVARGSAIKAGQDPAYYRAHLGSPEPEATVAGVRHYGNLFELPTVFYAACLAAYVLDALTGAVLGLAWAYAAARIVQSAVHLTYNQPAHRGFAFLIGAVALFAMWALLGAAICARL